MKKILLFTLCIGMNLQLFSQKEMISYQAVILGPNNEELVGIDAEGNIISEATISIRFSILDEENVSVYQEVQTTNPDQYGRINLFIGSMDGTEFEQIAWDGAPKRLKVEIDFSGSGNNFVDMSEEELTFLPQAYHRNIIATGTLTVDENTELKSDLTVKESALFQGALDIYGTTTLNDNLNVGGQVSIYPQIEGSQDELDSYPLRITGSHHGIAIQLKSNDSSNGDKIGIGRDQNFITFMGADGEAIGRIEGGGLEIKIAIDVFKAIFNGDSGVEIDNITYPLNTPEDFVNFRNTWFNNSQTKEMISIIQEIVKEMTSWSTTTLTVAGTLGTVSDFDDIIVETLDLKAKIKKLKPYIIKAGKNFANSGAVFESGGADYAEWLKKEDPNETFMIGDVVGIKGGLISKTFLDAEKYMVISVNPSVVGAMPQAGTESNYEKVAFMGQIPVNVIGPVTIGDYLLPSGIGDGIAIAINPAAMAARDYSKIIGVAWSNSNDANLYNFINTAVGINTNDMALMMNKMQDVMNNIQEAIIQINPEYKPIYFDASSTSELTQSKYAKSVDIIDNNRAKINGFIKDWINNHNGVIQKISEKFAEGFAKEPLVQLKELLQTLITEFTQTLGITDGPIFKLFNDIKNVESIADLKNIDFKSFGSHLNKVAQNINTLSGFD